MPTFSYTFNCRRLNPRARVSTSAYASQQDMYLLSVPHYVEMPAATSSSSSSSDLYVQPQHAQQLLLSLSSDDAHANTLLQRTVELRRHLYDLSKRCVKENYTVHSHELRYIMQPVRMNMQSLDTVDRISRAAHRITNLIEEGPMRDWSLEHTIECKKAFNDTAKEYLKCIVGYTVVQVSIDDFPAFWKANVMAVGDKADDWDQQWGVFGQKHNPLRAAVDAFLTCPRHTELHKKEARQSLLFYWWLVSFQIHMLLNGRVLQYIGTPAQFECSRPSFFYAHFPELEVRTTDRQLVDDIHPFSSDTTLETMLRGATTTPLDQFQYQFMMYYAEKCHLQNELHKKSIAYEIFTIRNNLHMKLPHAGFTQARVQNMIHEVQAMRTEAARIAPERTITGLDRIRDALVIVPQSAGIGRSAHTERVCTKIQKSVVGIKDANRYAKRLHNHTLMCLHLFTHAQLSYTRHVLTSDTVRAAMHGKPSELVKHECWTPNAMQAQYMYTNKGEASTHRAPFVYYIPSLFDCHDNAASTQSNMQEAMTFSNCVNDASPEYMTMNALEWMLQHFAHSALNATTLRTYLADAYKAPTFLATRVLLERYSTPDTSTLWFESVHEQLNEIVLYEILATRVQEECMIWTTLFRIYVRRTYDSRIVVYNAHEHRADTMKMLFTLQTQYKKMRTLHEERMRNLNIEHALCCAMTGWHFKATTMDNHSANNYIDSLVTREVAIRELLSRQRLRATNEAIVVNEDLIRQLQDATKCNASLFATWHVKDKPLYLITKSNWATQLEQARKRAQSGIQAAWLYLAPRSLIQIVTENPLPSAMWWQNWGSQSELNALQRTLLSSKNDRAKEIKQTEELESQIRAGVLRHDTMYTLYSRNDIDSILARLMQLTCPSASSVRRPECDDDDFAILEPYSNLKGARRINAADPPLGIAPSSEHGECMSYVRKELDRLILVDLTCKSKSLLADIQSEMCRFFDTHCVFLHTGTLHDILKRINIMPVVEQSDADTSARQKSQCELAWYCIRESIVRIMNERRCTEFMDEFILWRLFCWQTDFSTRTLRNAVELNITEDEHCVLQYLIQRYHETYAQHTQHKKRVEDVLKRLSVQQLALIRQNTECELLYAPTATNAQIEYTP